MSLERKEEVSQSPVHQREILCPFRCTLVVGLHIVAISSLYFWTVPALIAFLTVYVLVAWLGITVGYHRLLTHRSFSASPILRNVFAYLGAIALQGSPTYWVVAHRMHHAFTDSDGDPHSSARGFLWSHFLWMIHRKPNGFLFQDAKGKNSDVADTRFIRFLDKYYLLVNLASFLLFSSIFGLVPGLFAFPVRIVAFWHATWLVNSYAHQAGRRRKVIGPSARNSFLLNILVFGEGWHKNHHTYPSSASFQDKWWQFDLGYYSIKLFGFVGLASRIRNPFKEPDLLGGPELDASSSDTPKSSRISKSA